MTQHIETMGERFAQELVNLHKHYEQRIGRLEELLEDLMDTLTLEKAIANQEECFPGSIVERIVIKRENPVKVFREYRGLTQAVLAKKAGVSQTTIAEIESRKKKGSIGTLKAIASALDLELDDLV